MGLASGVRSRSRSTGSRSMAWRFRLGRGSILLMAACLVAGLAAGLMIPKIWRSTPVGFDPQIRISAIDMLQARSLAKSARVWEAARRPTEAFQAWRSAIANNPGDARLHQSLIECVLSQDNPDPNLLRAGAIQSMWLLRLTRTNDVSLRLCSRIFSRAGLDDELWELLSQPQVVVPSDVARIFAVVAFKTDHFDVFRRVWLQNEAAFKGDAELRLYDAAWTALSGSASEVLPAVNRLRAACETRDLRVLALQLKGWVEAQRFEVAALEGTLKALQEAHADRVEDHVRLWQLHNYLGHRQVAADAARAYVGLPKSSREVTLMMRAWNQLGLDDLVAEFAKAQIERFENLPEVWVLAASTLIKAKRWEELRLLAASMRKSLPISAYLASYVDFVDGMVETGLASAVPSREEAAPGKRLMTRAEELFSNIPKKRPASPTVAFEMAQSLIALGQHSIAFGLLEPLESQLGGRPEYWLQMVQCAHRKRQADVLLSITQKAYDRFPKNVGVANDRAVALLIADQNPGESVRLTHDVLRAVPSPGVQINHAIALIRNSRLDEAVTLLNSLPVDSLSPEVRSSWHFAQFEAAIARSDMSRATSEFAQINPQWLFPEQHARAKSTLEKGPRR